MPTQVHPAGTQLGHRGLNCCSKDPLSAGLCLLLQLILPVPLSLPNLGSTPPLLDLASPAPQPPPGARLPATGLCILLKGSGVRCLCQTHLWSRLCHAHDPQQDMASPSSACRAPPFPEAPGRPSGDLSEFRTLPHPELTTPPAHTVHTNVDSDSNPNTSGVTLTSGYLHASSPVKEQLSLSLS